jgi:hypothetical protein
MRTTLIAAFARLATPVCVAWVIAAAGLSTANAQTIHGKVVDRDNTPIEYAAIIVQTPDSLYVNATCTDSTGHFTLSINQPAYRLLIQHVQYETYEKSFSGEYDITVELTEKENVQGEVIISGEKPIVRLHEGRITYDMPLLLSGTTVNSAYESMLRLPGVREQNGSLTLAGAAGVSVIINGKATSMSHETLMTALKMYPAAMIQSAEIMYSAPPEYHVRGAAINLVLKGDPAGNSLQGQVHTTYTQKHYANHTEGLSLLIPASSKLTLDVNYAFNHANERSEVAIDSKHQNNGTVNLIKQSNEGNRMADDHHIRFGMDYKLTEKDHLNLAYTSQITNNVDNNELSSGTFSSSDNHKENKSPIQMHDVLVDYSTGFGLKAGMEYTFYKTRTDQDFTEKMTGKESEFTADAKQSIHRYRFFTDQSHPVLSGLLNYGAQYMYATDKSSQIYESVDLSKLNTDSQSTEHTVTAYAGFKKQIGSKLSVSASVTGEYYRLINLKEWTIFPAMEMMYFISPSQIMQLSFSSDKVYPTYWELHGAVSYLNGYSEIHGNPLLKPYRKYSGQLNYILNSKYILTAFYNYMDGYSVQLPYQVQDRLILMYKTLNMDYKQTAGLNLIIPCKTGKVVDMRLTLTGFYDKVKSSHFHDISFDKDNIVFYARLDNTINLSSKPNIKMEINGAYISKNIQGPAELTALWNLDAGLKWTFFHDMAELRLKGSDLLNKWTPDMMMKYDTQDLKMNIIPDSRAVSLSFTFKLGGYDKTPKEIDSSRFGTQ